jgi:recombination DNA repair RAD52 pathway protein
LTLLLHKNTNLKKDIKMKLNKTSNTTIRISNVNSLSNDTINQHLTSRLDTIPAEMDQASESRMDTEADTNLRKDNTQPVVKQDMDHQLSYSLYLLPPFI